MNSTPKEISLKKIIVIFTALLLLVGASWGGRQIYKKISARPLTPQESKKLVVNYLEKKSGQSDFKSSLDISQEKKPWQLLKVQYDAPPDYPTVYRLIGEHLSMADQLIHNSDSRQQENGLRIVTELCDVAQNVAVDSWLSARICDAYILPNLSKIEENPKRGLSREQLMHLAGKIYLSAEEKDKAIDLGKIYIAQTSSKSRADAARWRLGNLLENKGDRQEALKYYHEISDPNFKSKLSKHIAMLEQNSSQKVPGN